MIYAHSIHDQPVDTWETLQEHSMGVSGTAGRRARWFGSTALAETAGLLHDLGKSKPAFQARLQGAQNAISHSGEGALYALNELGPAFGKMLAYVIAGHHSGLPNGERRSDHRPQTPLAERLKSAEQVELPDWCGLPAMETPAPLGVRPINDSFTLQFYIRMLFSALVDADFVETEAFYTPGAREEFKTDLAALTQALQQRVARFDRPRSDLNRLRAAIYERAGQVAKTAPGFFSLTVPTGGGKTLSSLRFALDHARHNGMRRVIHVAPFTAIIEQTAEVFRDAVGDRDAVLEHHSSFDLAGDLPEDEAERMRMAAQNWDRPVVVTTAVQFYESLFANRTQKCRKLHNIAGSVIVLDEAQSLPVPLLHACLAALRELVRGYGCSVVFCTATQPAIFKEQGMDLPEAPTLAETAEIAPDPPELFRKLRRVEGRYVGPIEDVDLAEALADRPALVIVNNKTHARSLFDRMAGQSAHHLTTNMTPLHRRDTLDRVKAQLAGNEPVTLISTALIEAGVDISFPEVWRATTGLDSIAQAAGRCNREGELDGLGRLTVFDPDEAFPPPPELRQNAEIARRVMAQHADILSPEAVEAYFRDLYWDNITGLDRKAIMAGITESEFLNCNFADLAASFRMIEDFTVPMIVGVGDWGIPKALRDMFEYSEFAGSIARAVQPYTVPVLPRTLNALLASGDVALMRPDKFEDQFPMLLNPELYDAAAGFSPEGKGLFSGIL